MGTGLRVTWIAEAGKVRIVPWDEAKRFWDGIRPPRAGSWNAMKVRIVPWDEAGRRFSDSIKRWAGTPWPSGCCRLAA